MFQIPRVLVQYVQTPDLAFSRSMTSGAKFGSPVQQLGIEWHEPDFPVALAMATRNDQGAHIIQVGFKGAVRYTGEGWEPDGWLATDPDVEMFQSVMSGPTLVQFAYARLSPEEMERVTRRARVVSELVARFKVEREAALALEREDVLRKPHNNREVFDQVATPLKDRDVPAVIRATWKDE